MKKTPQDGKPQPSHQIEGEYLDFVRERERERERATLNIMRLESESKEYNGSEYVPAGAILLAKIQDDSDVQEVASILSGEKPLPDNVRTIQLLVFF